MRIKLIAVGGLCLFALAAGCGSSKSGGSTSASGGATQSPGARDAGPGDAGAWCQGPATGALIDDMSGSNISLAPPSCGTRGNWTLEWDPDADGGVPITNPAIFGSKDAAKIAYHCGSLCENIYSPLPSGFPGTVAVADAGARGPMAMCIAGTTPATLYEGAEMDLWFGHAGDMPDGGMYWDSVNEVLVPQVALIDASAYSGIQFWLWVSADTVTGMSAAFAVSLGDKNETAGCGVCDPNSSTETACGAASAAAVIVGSDTTAGPLLNSDGVQLTSLSAGWQLVRVPWASFHLNQWWGGLNETAVDPKLLTYIVFRVQQGLDPDAGLVPVAFDYCVYQLSFYK